MIRLPMQFPVYWLSYPDLVALERKLGPTITEDEYWQLAHGMLWSVWREYQRE